MKIMKRTLINAFAFAREGRTETGASCIIWSGHTEKPMEERMVLNEDGTFNRLERRHAGKGGWKLSKLQGNPKFHNELLDKVRELGWSFDEVWRQPMGICGTPEHDEIV